MSDKVKRTYGDVVIISQALGLIPTRKGDKRIDDKLTSAVEKFLHYNRDVITQYNRAISDLEEDHALTDKNGKVIYEYGPNNERLFSYSITGLRKLRAAKDKLMEKAIYFIPKVVTDCPRIAELSFEVKFILNGLLFDLEIEE